MLLLLLSLHMRVYKLPFNSQLIPEIKGVAKAIIENERETLVVEKHKKLKAAQATTQKLLKPKADAVLLEEA